MTKKAFIFGSIGTVAETSELQRQSFNQAFIEAGLKWSWDPEEYGELLKKPGGEKRIAEYGEDTNAKAVHSNKSKIFQEKIRKLGLTLRPGVEDLIQTAKDQGIALAFATTTETANIDAFFDASDVLVREDFDFIGDLTKVSKSKPDPEIYKLALESLGVSADDALAVEDSAANAAAPIAAGIETLYFPGEYSVPEAEGASGRHDTQGSSFLAATSQSAAIVFSRDTPLATTICEIMLISLNAQKRPASRR